jgi:putative flippase GtrA
MLNRPFLRWVAVGAMNTCVHFIASLVAVEIFNLSLQGSNIFGFVVANALSYAMNSIWTFKIEMNTRRYAKFFSISSVSLAFSAVVLQLMVFLGLGDKLSVLLGAASVALCNYYLSRRIVFREAL